MLLIVDKLYSKMTEFANEDCQLCSVDGEWEATITQQIRDDSNLGVPVKSSDLFNIIYTSGTSGKPKGVMVHHRGIANVITWYGCEFNIKEASR